MKKTIAGKEYDYTLCPRCQVWILTENLIWIQTEDFSGYTHESCDHNYAALEIRRRAEARVMGRLAP